MAKPKTITQEQLDQVNQDYFIAFVANNEEFPEEYIKARTNDFLEDYGFDAQPSRWAKQISGWTKNNLLLDAWNQYIAFEEAMGEQVWGMTASDTIGEVTRLDLLKRFVPYLQGYVEGIEECLSNDETVSNETV